MRRVSSFLRLLGLFLGPVPTVADWLLVVLEKAVVIVVATGVIVGGAFLIFGEWSDVSSTRVGKVIAFLDQHWKAILLLVIPLFYLPIRRFLEELDEVRGFRRRRPEEPTETTVGTFGAPSGEDEGT